MKKNTKLFIILILFIAISATIALIDINSKKKNFEPDIFRVLDIDSIQSVAIKGKGIDNLIERNGDQWRLNNKYDTDTSRIKILNTILSLVIVKRPVAKLNNADILNDLEQMGKKVTVKLKNGSQISFISGGNASKTTSYYTNPSGKQAYIVEISGYNNYISGIFELTENQWRDRMLFSTSWRTLKNLQIAYQNQPDLQIAFEDKFLKVKDIHKMDTTALLNYLQQFEYFQINDYLILGNYPKYDSLLRTNPFANMTISDIDSNKNKQLSVFPKMKGEQFYLLTDESKQMMVVDQKRMESLLVSKQQFKMN